jgi:hypothetical protein
MGISDNSKEQLILLGNPSCGLLGYDTMLWYDSTMKNEEAWPSKMLVSYHITTWCHKPEGKLLWHSHSVFKIV